MFNSNMVEEVMVSAEVMARNAATLVRKRRRIVREAQSRYVDKRENLPVEERVDLILDLLREGELVRSKLRDRVNIPGTAFDEAISYAEKFGLIMVEKRRAHKNGSGPLTTVYRLNSPV